MEQLVVVYTVTDECTYSNEIVVALTYDSAEAFYVHFQQWVVDRINDAEANKTYPSGSLQVGRFSFDVCHFRSVIAPVWHENSKERRWAVEMPAIYTLRDWFTQNAVN